MHVRGQRHPDVHPRGLCVEPLRLLGRGLRVLIRVVLPWAVFGLIVEDGIVVEAAPIAAWATGKSAREVLAYYKGRGARLERI